MSRKEIYLYYTIGVVEALVSALNFYLALRSEGSWQFFHLLFGLLTAIYAAHYIGKVLNEVTQ